MKTVVRLMTAIALLVSLHTAWAENPAVEAMQEYMDFANYEAGIIVPEQLTEAIFPSVLFVDTRDSRQFEAGTIPGAVNIEWREVLARRNEIPTDRKVVLFCNTGSLSSQALFALRVAGVDNVLVLQTGFNGWKENAAYKPE
jgi:rhodanese-related sulfurtransferase